MNYRVLIVSSVTYAMKAKNELLREAISCRVEKIKKISNQKGCGYGVVVREMDQERAIRVMRNANIRIIDVLPYKDGKR